ncbi:hypothetical protein ACWHLZ_27985 [Streptomyces chartreusis]|uniref:hypothetical protein n=1 Tax=Streptomyces chartreusis TaxID=1969 RepID=UPI00341B8AD7
MGLLDRLLGNDRERAETKYAGRESASEKAARRRRASQQRGVAKAAAEGEKWERKDRARDRRGERHTDWRN